MLPGQLVEPPVDLRRGQAVVGRGDDPVELSPGQHRREPVPATGSDSGAAYQEERDVRARGRPRSGSVRPAGSRRPTVPSRPPRPPPRRHCRRPYRPRPGSPCGSRSRRRPRCPGARPARARRGRRGWCGRCGMPLTSGPRTPDADARAWVAGRHRYVVVQGQRLKDRRQRVVAVRLERTDRQLQVDLGGHAHGHRGRAHRSRLWSRGCGWPITAGPRDRHELGKVEDLPPRCRVDTRCGQSTSSAAATDPAQEAKADRSILRRWLNAASITANTSHPVRGRWRISAPQPDEDRIHAGHRPKDRPRDQADGARLARTRRPSRWARRRHETRGARPAARRPPAAPSPVPTRWCRTPPAGAAPPVPTRCTGGSPPPPWVRGRGLASRARAHRRRSPAAAPRGQGPAERPSAGRAAARIGSISTAPRARRRPAGRV